MTHRVALEYAALDRGPTFSLFRDRASSVRRLLLQYTPSDASVIHLASPWQELPDRLLVQGWVIQYVSSIARS